MYEDLIGMYKDPAVVELIKTQKKKTEMVKLHKTNR